MADLVWVQWYATILRQTTFAADVARVAPLALRYGATQYQVHVNADDRYKITQMTWFERKSDWYRYWDGPEMIEFRARNMGHYQVPINYSWAQEIAAGALGPEVPAPELEPGPTEPAPQAAA
ncbi:MAG: hypothetical protein QOF83_2724 [Solirubrobacteraceae bacterium]|nr:hypothetical protein [Solirubrobacteraceae bacterium]